MRKRPGSRIIALMAIGIILVVATRAGWLRPVWGILGRITNPISAAFSGAGGGLANFGGLVGHIKDLSAENNRLRDQVATLRQQLAADAELKSQNEALRQQLGFGESARQELIPAEIIAYQPDNFRAFVTIGRGRRDNIRSGMAVISQGSLVGRISEVSEASAKVLLLTDPDFKVSGLDQVSRASGTVKGQIGSGLIMDKIPQDQTIKSGDTIVTAGLGGEVPKGLIIGSVGSVNQKDNAVFQSALVVSSVKFNHLELVFVVKQ